MALQFLSETSRDINSTLQLNEVFEKIADRVRLLIDYHLFCVMLWSEQTQLLEHSYSVCFGKHIEMEGGFPLGTGLSGSCAQLQKSIRVPDVSLDSRYVRHRHPEVEIRSELAVPLVTKGRLVGVIDLESTEYDAFSEAHEEMLNAVARHVATALDNARLYERVYADEQRMENELVMAREIQKALLPGTPPVIPGIEIGTGYAPARELAGDFFDFLPYAEGCLAFTVGDVAGKGTAAALYGTLTVGMMRGHALKNLRNPAAVLQHMNDQMRRLDIDGCFVAMIFGMYDSQFNRLTLSNAGFQFPILVRRGSATKINLPGFPVGILANSSYDEEEIVLQNGDVVVFCSDGFQDSENEAGIPYGEPRLEALLEDISNRSAQEIADQLVYATSTHSGNHAEPTDDRAVVVIKVVAR